MNSLDASFARQRVHRLPAFRARRRIKRLLSQP